jgi:hypothetical protein
MSHVVHTIHTTMKLNIFKHVIVGRYLVVHTIHTTMKLKLHTLSTVVCTEVQYAIIIDSMRLCIIIFKMVASNYLFFVD